MRLTTWIVVRSPRCSVCGNEPPRVALRPAFNGTAMTLLALLVAANLAIAGTFSFAALAAD
ncbi:hypothetical protein [Methylobacterium sp. J-077]|uniref:hypothetical protein n=1 Tax=Methylobacterium sp. J-077 TaxID=2836656 RepID=UPI001FBA4D0A|nr:hypothetical protein [Methylobacterium sp. J-077]MCJ2124588.1 hypothetical protein [Methylobacterium sp. J-077]